MTKILVGGPEGERRSAHDDLVTRLRKEYEVEYVQDADGTYFLYHALGQWPLEKKPDLILYDSNFFYPEATDKVAAFNHGASFVTAGKCQVIVLTEPGMETVLESAIKAAGYYQINQPYEIVEVVAEVMKMLESA